MSRLEPHVPSLHRNPDSNRYTLSLLLVAADGRSTGQVIPVAKGWRSGDLRVRVDSASGAVSATSLWR